MLYKLDPSSFNVYYLDVKLKTVQLLNHWKNWTLLYTKELSDQELIELLYEVAVRRLVVLNEDCRAA